MLAYLASKKSKERSIIHEYSKSKNKNISCKIVVSSAISQSKSPSTEQEQVEDHSTIQFDSESSSDDEGSVEDPEDGNRTSGLSKSLESGSTDSDDADNHHSTMWLGTEDGCIHVYNSSDNIRIKKNKIRLQHGSAILSIM